MNYVNGSEFDFFSRYKLILKSKKKLTLVSNPPNNDDHIQVKPTTSGTHKSHKNYFEQDEKMFVESIIDLDDSDDNSDLDESTEISIRYLWSHHM